MRSGLRRPRGYQRTGEGGGRRTIKEEIGRRGEETIREVDAACRKHGAAAARGDAWGTEGSSGGGLGRFNLGLMIPCRKNF